jgi:hypothetical protein
MNRRMLVALLVSLVVLVALAVAVSISQQRDTGSGQLLLPDLKARLNDIERIVVRTGGDRKIATLERRKDGWILAERDGYPADVGLIRKNLIALAEARVLEEKTSNPELYGRLRVDDVEKPEATGVRLDLTAGQTSTGVIVGATGVGGGERAYVRLAAEPTSWLVSGGFEVPAEPDRWLDRSVTDIDAKRIRAVTITHPDAPPVRIEKDSAEATDFKVLDVPPKRELSFPGVGNAIGAALAGLTLDNVEPAAAFAPADVRPVVARFETFDGLVVEASGWRLPAGLRFRFAASATQDSAKAEADAINARLGNWVYTLPEFKSEQLTRRLPDLLQPLPPGK